MLRETALKKKLRTDQPVVGIWNTLGSPLVTEALASAGLDFQVIDLEHGPFILDKVHEHVSACESVGTCSPLVRIPSLSSWMILQALDQGGHGLVLPHIENIEDVLAVGKWCHYPPKGERGFSPFTKAGGFGSRPAADYAFLTSEALVNVVIVESRQGLENLDQILSSKTIDVVYFGAYDLSIEFGVPGNMGHVELVRAVEKGARKVRDAGLHVGAFVPTTVEEVRSNLALGLNFVTYSVDSEVLRAGVSAAVSHLADLV